MRALKQGDCPGIRLPLGPIAAQKAAPVSQVFDRFVGHGNPEPALSAAP